MTANPSVPRVPVAILAGGMSRRMGSDKARVVVGSDAGPLALIASVARAVAPVASQILIVGGGPDLASVVAASTNIDVAWTADMWPGEGPLGGIVSALRGVTGPASPVLTVSCDLVDLDVALLSQLLGEANRSTSDVCVPLVHGQRQWHLAAWGPGALAVLAAAFAGGERSIRRGAVALAQTLVVSAAAERLCDLDTPEDVATYNQAWNTPSGIGSSGADT